MITPYSIHVAIPVNSSYSLTHWNRSPARNNGGHLAYVRRNGRLYRCRKEAARKLKLPMASKQASGVRKGDTVIITSIRRLQAVFCALARTSSVRLLPVGAYAKYSWLVNSVLCALWTKMLSKSSVAHRGFVRGLDINLVETCVFWDHCCRSIAIGPRAKWQSPQELPRWWQQHLL